MQVLLIFMRYFIPKLETLFEKGFQELKVKARLLGKAHADRKLPPLNAKEYIPFIQPLITKAQSLGALIDTYVQPKIQQLEGKLDEKAWNEAKKAAKERISEISNQIKSILYDMTDENPWIVVIKVLLALIITFGALIGEVWLTTTSLQIVGESWISARTIAISINLVVVAYAHIGVHWLKETANPWMRRLIVIGSLLVVGALYYVLATYRAEYMEVFTGLKMNPFSFVVISEFIFVAIGLVAFWLDPSWAELKSSFLNAYKQILINIKNGKINRLTKRMDKGQAKFDQSKKERLRYVDYAKNKKKEVKRQYREAVGIYIEHNIAHRGDGISKSFDNGIPDIDIE